MILVVVVLGTQLAGIASPTEAAGVGAFRCIVIFTFQRKFSWLKPWRACANTLKATWVGPLDDLRRQSLCCSLCCNEEATGT